MAHQPGASFAGRYTLERVLGRGATASVWLAQDAVTTERVALKILREELSSNADRAHFLREIRRMAGFAHPRILPVLDAGDDAGTLYFALPYMPDGTLRRQLEREGQLPVADVLRVARALADALGYAHAHGFVHRDVKPENILFRDGEAHLTDFGICRALENTLDESTTSRALVRGTPAYMSPEQASGERDYDGRSDLFSLGCVLYEMLAGVPAFVGPSAQMVIAQRFLHAPHALAVYRPAVPAALDAVISKCLQIQPADRYRDAGALAAALATIDPDAAVGTPSGAMRTTASAPKRRLGRRVLLPLAAAGFAISVGWGVSSWRDARGGLGAAPDTTLIVVFPLERRNEHDEMTGPLIDDGLLRDAFSTWDGLSLVDQFRVRDALRRDESTPTVDALGRIARRLGAGRFVRGELSASGDETIAYLALFDVDSTLALHELRAQVPNQHEGAIDAYREAAWTLLMRGESLPDSEGTGGSGPPRRSLAGAQVFAAAQDALDEWDLARADTLFERALGFERDDAQSMFWLAQVRSWRGRNVRTWSSFAARAARADSLLPEREQRLASALWALADARYSDACETYDSLSQRNNTDFAALYGLGQCHSMDPVVVRDASSSPTGWRFRSSRHAALRAYESAFAALPSVHRGYEGSAYEGLRQLLFVSSWIADGFSLPDSAAFQARPSWRGDTLALIPVPWSAAAGGAIAAPEGFSEALARQRQSFRRITAGWSAAFPSSSEAKEAVAIALELLGNPAAIDTMRAARRLTADPAREITLGVAEVRLLLRFGIPADTLSLQRARSLADSILLATTVRTPGDARRLATLAALASDCDRAQRLMTAQVPPTGYFDIPPDLLAESQRLLARAALNCGSNEFDGAFRLFVSRVAEMTRGKDAGTARLYNDVLLLRPLLMSGLSDSALIRQVTNGGGPAVARAAFALAAGDREAVAKELTSSDPLPGSPPRTPDFAWIGTLLWMQIADTANALRWADEALADVRVFDFEVLGDAVSIAAIVNLMKWRGAVAEMQGDRVTSRRWQDAVRSIRHP